LKGEPLASKAPATGARAFNYGKLLLNQSGEECGWKAA
jgi:hypothetical protein